MYVIIPSAKLFVSFVVVSFVRGGKVRESKSERLGMCSTLHQSYQLNKGGGEGVGGSPVR